MSVMHQEFGQRSRTGSESHMMTTGTRCGIRVPVEETTLHLVETTCTDCWALARLAQAQMRRIPDFLRKPDSPDRNQP